MSDLTKQATSMHKTASGLGAAGHRTAKPLQGFRAQSDDPGALGPVEREAEAKSIGEVSDASDLLDVLIAAEAQGQKG